MSRRCRRQRARRQRGRCADHWPHGRQGEGGDAVARAIGGVAPVVAGVVYGASQQERRGETGRVCGVPYGGVVPVVAGVVYGASQ